jgi:hypothetical protein
VRDGTTLYSAPLLLGLANHQVLIAKVGAVLLCQTITSLAGLAERFELTPVEVHP